MGFFSKKQNDNFGFIINTDDEPIKISGNLESILGTMESYTIFPSLYNSGESNKRPKPPRK